jgi:pimeloyl-[acyl-carrier protein] methyl ester esterase
MTGIAFLHGWGFGPSAWARWAAAFPDRPVALLDAGYFGPERLALPENDGGWIGVGHSLGFARLLGMEARWKGLVGLGAFLRFCTRPGHASGTPVETLDAMIARLDADPADVLARFLRRCGLKGHAPATPPAEGLARLRRDLSLLRGLDLTPPAQLPPVLLLHAADDRIAPLALAEEAHTGLAGAKRATFESGGHALPFSRVDDCLPLVREFIDGLEPSDGRH